MLMLQKIKLVIFELDGNGVPKAQLRAMRVNNVAK
jgi:hypothetical protein